MNVYNTVKNGLILYPSIYKNALDVYSHMFICIGNGYEWKNGQLVSIEDRKLATVEEGVIKCLNFHLVDHDPEEYMDALKPLLTEEQYRKHKIANYKRYIDEVKDVFRWEEKIDDFSFAWDEEYQKLHERNEKHPHKQTFINFCNYSKICNLPDNIKKDWLEAAEKMYNIIIENIDRLECRKDETELLTKVKERIKELKKKFQ